MPRGLAPRILYSLKFEEFLHYNRIEKWTLLVMIAFVWCYKTGIFIHENVKKIKINTDERPTVYSNVGCLNIANILLSFENKNSIDMFRFLSCT